ncbi:right-handed parallel beta-helix repeat-containing protein [Thalassoglobus sp. JC818]|uniref:right-handed parallel beta-helix repeat-containing protein n=1 Tax=Thalassoglobus sp. JC818 TaxID=3232136 RepID=UPI003458D6F7
MNGFQKLVITLLACASVASSTTASDRWNPYVEGETRWSSERLTGRGGPVVPLWQDDQTLLFTDLRGLVAENSFQGGSFGLACRTMVSSQRILGFNTFYDVLNTSESNTFHQAGIGAELLSVDWGVRANGYLPQTGSRSAAGESTTFLADEDLFVRAGLEAAYWGMNVEAERRLLWTGGAPTVPVGDVELWAAAGMFHFENDTFGFDNMTGPRLRTELRVYDLPCLGFGSRFVFGGQYDYDDVRGSVGTASVNLRISLDLRKDDCRERTSGLSRRMLDPIVRNVEIVTNRGSYGAPEPAKFSRTDRLVDSVIVLTADDDITNRIEEAGEDSVVILDGSLGEFETTTETVLNDGQVVMGGQARLQVYGCETGARAVFYAPGERPTVRYSGFGEEAIFYVADRSAIIGLNLVGGPFAIYGESPQDVLIQDNILRSNEAGILLLGDVVADVVGNDVSENDEFGIAVQRFHGGNISNNTLHRNGEDGLSFQVVSAGTVFNNQAHQNGSNGIAIDTLEGGLIVRNVASENDDDGFDVDEFYDGVMTQNIARGNLDDGFDFDEMYGGIASENLAIGNDEFGFEIIDFDGGELFGNSAGENLAGFFIESLDGGTLANNKAFENEIDGFVILGLDEGVVRNNRSLRNGDDGYYFRDVDAGLISNNASRRNSGDGFDIEFEPFNTSEFSFNHSSRNRERGYNFDDDLPSIGEGTNTGRSNQADDRF